MVERTAWEVAATATGTTKSERALTRLAKKAFLSLWSYSNPFTDEGRGGGKGDGKELCDFLVVFGNNVLLFSDKDCEFKAGPDIQVAWSRWYRRAIEKSARQLAGAEKFLKKHGDRVFLDKDCQTRLPVALPDPSVARYYLIAVTRGSHDACKVFYRGGSSGSILLDSSINGSQHYDRPFRVGNPLLGRFVHVLDEMTVDLLLEELDTVPDLVAYLDCKEKFLQPPKVTICIPGEEELLARYMTTMRDDQHALPTIPDGTTFVMLPEGDWLSYSTSEQRAVKRSADRDSYMWDDLIEHQSTFIRAGTATTVPWQPADKINHERILRALAEQNRVSRRNLSEQFRYALSKNEPGRMFSRTVMTSAAGSLPSLAFIFLTISRLPSDDYEDYRAARREALIVYCHGIKETWPSLKEAVGIASEPFSETDSSQDFLYVNLSEEMSEDESKAWRKAADELDILRPKTEVELHRNGVQEFPLGFEPVFTDGMKKPDDRLPNRAERRRMAKLARSKKRHPR
jgi:hypothetical protein